MRSRANRTINIKIGCFHYVSLYAKQCWQGVGVAPNTLYFSNIIKSFYGYRLIQLDYSPPIRRGRDSGVQSLWVPIEVKKL